jgi:hypothetical protein
LEIAIQNRSDHIFVQVRGEFEMWPAVNLFRDILVECKETGVSKVLLDNQELMRPPGFSDTFQYNEIVTEYYQVMRNLGCPPLRMAYVLAEGTEALVEYGREIGGESGIELLVTTDMSEAEGWLGVGG